MHLEQESISQMWHQNRSTTKFGAVSTGVQANRTGWQKVFRNCFYHENDLQHATFWCKGENCERQSQLLTEFQTSWRYLNAAW